MTEDDPHIGHNSRSRLEEVVERRAELQARYKMLVEEAEATEEQLKHIDREILPDIMAEIGTTEAKVGDFKITIGESVFASISDDRAYHWLDSEGLGGLIKTEVKMVFNRDERKRAVEAVSEMREKGYEAELKEQVHWATLRSWATERISQGKPIPPEYFDVGSFTEAKVKLAETKKRK